MFTLPLWWFMLHNSKAFWGQSGLLISGGTTTRTLQAYITIHVVGAHASQLARRYRYSMVLPDTSCRSSRFGSKMPDESIAMSSYAARSNWWLSTACLSHKL
ncbi:hypothetical protein O3G_MSEX003704 [Manduca sexta]|uniref:Secreted protein n=1 Tax=Manduca sexta TaxID=7130 RepID=A0A921YT15_MANSE|nr:hypothetical protein O3G_MSEX003704 [Manduca sexta]